MGQSLTLQTVESEAFEAYLEGNTNAPCAVLVLHEWWGLKPHNRQWVDDFAAAGYLAMAIDLYDGRVTDEVDEASRWMKDIDQAVVDRKLETALDYLGLGGRKVVTYGCSFGGRESMRASLLRPQNVVATVIGYSRMETDAAALAHLRGPVFVIYAEQERGWPDKQTDFEQAMATAGKITESASYDAAHGFTNPTSARFDAKATAGAWQATLDFLKRACLAG